MTAGRGYVDLKIAVIARFGKRYFAANQKKRVQRVEDSLAQVWGRVAPNVLPAENMARLMCLRKSVPTPRRRLRSPRPFVLRRDRHKETYMSEVNPPSPITV